MIRRIRQRRRSNDGWSRRIFCAVTAFAPLTVWFAAESAHAQDSAEAFIRSLGDTVIRELAPDEISPDEREARFRALMHENFDVPRITRFALGRYARRVSTVEMEKFSVLYEDLAALTYAHMFAAYAGQGFSVIKQLGAPGDKYVMVVSEISEPGGTFAARLDWQVLVRKAGFAVVDIRVEGVSMAIAQRDEFTAYLDQNNGDMSVFLMELAAKVDKLRKDRADP